MRRMIAAALAAFVLSTLPAMAAPVVAPGTSADLCAAETGKAERQYGIPTQLLDAISLVESGRYDPERRATSAWPWTVTADGQGRYFPSKAEAIAEVKKLRARGVRSIDVGCMQVNLMWHGDAFASLEDAFDPAANVAYAARFLKGLYGATSHWPTAASYYHSQTPELAAAYRERLMKVWRAGPEVMVASARPSAKGATQGAKPPAVEDKRQAARMQELAMRDEARRIADAYRQARLAEYQMRRAHFVELRRVADRR